MLMDSNFPMGTQKEMTHLLIYDQMQQFTQHVNQMGRFWPVNSEDAFYGSRPAVETKDSNRNGLVFHCPFFVAKNGALEFKSNCFLSLQLQIMEGVQMLRPGFPPGMGPVCSSKNGFQIDGSQVTGGSEVKWLISSIILVFFHCKTDFFGYHPVILESPDIKSLRRILRRQQLVS